MNERFEMTRTLDERREEWALEEDIGDWMDRVLGEDHPDAAERDIEDVTTAYITRIMRATGII